MESQTKLLAERETPRSTSSREVRPSTDGETIETAATHQDGLDAGSGPGEGAFSPAFPWIASSVTALFILIIVLMDWVLKSEGGERNIKELPSSLADAGRYISQNGWGIIGVAVSLLAISVTVVSIIGLDNFENIGSVRRHELIFSLAGTFVNAAICLLSALVIGALLSQIFAQFDSKNINSAALLMLLAVALIMWLCAKTTHKKLSDVAMGDYDSRLRERAELNAQLTHYKKLRDRSAAPLKRRGVDFGSRFGLHAFWVCFYSVLFILGASAVAAALVWVPVMGGNYVGSLSEWGRFFRVLAGASGLSATVMVLSSLPFMMGADYLKARESGYKGMVIAAGSIGITCCLPLIVVGALGWGVFDGFESSPGWPNIVLFALIIAPTICGIFFPLRYSWLMLSNLSATQQLNSRIRSLETRLSRL